MKAHDILAFFTDEKSCWNAVKEALREMEEMEFIEERHFGKQYQGRVDYCIQNEGIAFMKKKRKDLKLEERWKSSL